MRFPSESERQKRARLIELLDTGVVLVNLDPRVEGADVPTQFRQQPVLGLNLSRRYHLDVFEVGPLAVKASLSFGGDRYLCVLPWTAIFSMSAQADGTSESWPESFPPELLAQIARGAARRDGEAADEGAPPPRRRIRGRRGNAAASYPEDGADESGAEQADEGPAAGKQAEAPPRGLQMAFKVASPTGKSEKESEGSTEKPKADDEPTPEPPRPPSGRPNLRIVK